MTTLQPSAVTPSASLCGVKYVQEEVLCKHELMFFQSAGGSSVDIYSYAWRDDPIVTGFAADSGSAASQLLPQYGGANFSFLASKVGCGGLKASAELTCMQNVPAGTLENTLSAYLVSEQEPSISFTPVVDSILTFENYTERALAGQVAQRVRCTIFKIE